MIKESTCKTLGIYIHIPFCVRKCLYCDFLSAPAGREEMNRYVSALIREIRGESSRYTRYIVKSVFLGGGTPSLLPAESIAEILTAIYDCFNLDRECEISMEVNPGTVTQDKCSLWRKNGVNRLSIGLQSAVDSELKILGRIHTGKDFLDTYALAAKTGFDNINIDLMSGIPGQTLESYTYTLKIVTGLEPVPAHISSYSLIIEEGTAFYENTPVLPDEDCEREMYKITGGFLSELGYRQYEISNYALPGHECIHNVRYWERGDYAGFGIGAASLVNNERFRNTNNIDRYCSFYLPEGGQRREDDLIGSGGIKEERQILSVEEQMEEFMFLGLRMIKGVSCQEFFSIFGVTIDQAYPGVVSDFCQKGLLERRRDPETGEVRVALTGRGIDVSNVVMAQFLEPAFVAVM